MMTRIEELEKQIQELQKELEFEKNKSVIEYPFEKFESYWTMHSGDKVFQARWSNHDLDFERYSQGNVFKTKKEAERERDKRALLTRFRQFRDKCNEEWKQKREDCIDFNGYHIEVYNGNDDGMLLRSDWDPVCERFCLFGYFKKQVDCDRAIELFGDEIKRLYLEW